MRCTNELEHFQKRRWKTLLCHILNNGLGRNSEIALNLQDGENCGSRLTAVPELSSRKRCAGCRMAGRAGPIRISVALCCFCALIIFVDAGVRERLRERAEARDEQQSEISKGLAWLR